MFQVEIITRAFTGLKTTFSISVTFFLSLFYSVIDFVLLREQVQHHQKLTFQSLFLSLYRVEEWGLVIYELLQCQDIFVSAQLLLI